MNKHVVGIAGSVRNGSYTQTVLRFILEEIKKNGLTVEELLLSELNLPFFLGNQEEKAIDSIKFFKQKIASASGIIIATPEYHGSMSGILKNALDFLEDELSGKVAGVVSVMGGAYGGSSIEHARTVLHKLKAWVVPQDLIIQKSNLIFDEKGDVSSLDVEKRLKTFADQFSKAIISFNNSL